MRLNVKPELGHGLNVFVLYTTSATSLVSGHSSPLRENSYLEVAGEFPEVTFVREEVHTFRFF
jgi:hypothetical protein